jgi:cupredoxin-like protein
MILGETMRVRASALALAAVLTAGSNFARAQETVVEITVKNHRFEPSEPRAPANRAFTIRIRNLDSTPMEFESVKLRAEKVVAANSEGVVKVRALSPGRYDFFDDFHKQTRGTLVVE